MWNFTQQCDDKDLAAEYILKLNEKDDYGVRDSLIYNAGRMLPEPRIRLMIAHLQRLPESPESRYQLQHNFLRIEALARQIKDAPLFEQTRLRCWGRLNPAAYVDIAEVYLECGIVPCPSPSQWLPCTHEQPPPVL